MFADAASSRPAEGHAAGGLSCGCILTICLAACPTSLSYHPLLLQAAFCNISTPSTWPALMQAPRMALYQGAEPPRVTALYTGGYRFIASPSRLFTLAQLLQYVMGTSRRWRVATRRGQLLCLPWHAVALCSAECRVVSCSRTWSASRVMHAHRHAHHCAGADQTTAQAIAANLFFDPSISDAEMAAANISLSNSDFQVGLSGTLVCDVQAGCCLMSDPPGWHLTHAARGAMLCLCPAPPSRGLPPCSERLVVRLSPVGAGPGVRHHGARP